MRHYWSKPRKCRTWHIMEWTPTATESFAICNQSAWYERTDCEISNEHPAGQLCKRCEREQERFQWIKEAVPQKTEREIMRINASDLAAVKTNNQPAVNGRQSVTVTDIDLPFWRIVGIMVKWSIASIPAFIILAAIGFTIFLMLGMFGAAVMHR